MLLAKFRSETQGQILAFTALSLGVSCSGHGTCPPHGLMVNGATCHGDDLQCPETVTVTACDRTQSTLVTSCDCVEGKWQCPDPGTPACTDGGTITAAGGGGSTTTAVLPPRSSGSSCPFVFVWDGSGFQYETDLAGITIGLPPGTTANASIPLAGAGTSATRLSRAVFDPKDGIEIHLRETVREISYIDWVRLIVVDAPAGVEVFDNGAESTSEWGVVSPLTFYTSQGARAPVQALDQRWLDVTKQLSAEDNSPAPLADNGTNSYTLDFGAITRSENAKLLIDGWSIYAILADHDVQPFVEAEDSQGNWTVVKKFGAPYGDMKTVVVDLGGNLPIDVQRLRVNLGLENGARWSVDRIRLDESAPVSVTTSFLDPTVALLTHRGRATLHRCTYLSRAEALDDENPDDLAQYGYGTFTAYGDVLELVSALDDRLVILRHGDQLTLQFPGLRVPPNGGTRTILVQTDVTMKSFILGNSVEPLPFHGMSTYPYSSPESYPADAVHQAYQEEYNTRYYAAP